jgi:hypothetical protein
MLIARGAGAGMTIQSELGVTQENPFFHFVDIPVVGRRGIDPPREGIFSKGDYLGGEQKSAKSSAL